MGLNCGDTEETIIDALVPATASIRLNNQDEAVAVFGEGDRNLKRLKEKLGARIQIGRASCRERVLNLV